MDYGVSNPAAPKELSRLSDIRPVSVAISGNYAYIKNGNQELDVADISDPVYPQIVSKSILPAPHLKISGSLLFPYSSSELHIIDISSPLSLKEIGYFPNPGHDLYNKVDGRLLAVPAAFADVAIVGNYVYIASGVDGMRVVDISNPSTPHEIKDLQTQEKVADNVFILGNLAYLIISGSVDVINISDPTAVQIS